MAPIRTLTGLLLLFCIVSEFIPAGNALSCIRCNISMCIPPTGCNHGVIDDLCHCCQRCAKGLGEQCGGIWTQDGKCAEGLGCNTTILSMELGRCIPASEVQFPYLL